MEAPGYCPPGPKCLFHLTVYRHSRLPSPPQIRIFGVNLKFAPVMALLANRIHGDQKVMKTPAFVTIGTAALALAACNKGNPDAVQNAEINQPDSELNQIANQAAMDAANAQAAAANLRFTCKIPRYGVPVRRLCR